MRTHQTMGSRAKKEKEDVIKSEGVGWGGVEPLLSGWSKRASWDR